MTRGSVVVTSQLAATQADVWERITTVEGINDELRPWLRMTAPPGVRSLADLEITPGERIFRSKVLLFGVLPVEYDDLGLESLDPGRGFHERSEMRSIRVWEHIRTLSPFGDGCTVRDELLFEARAFIPITVVRIVIGALFRHRHRRLRRRFGGVAA